MSVLIKLIAAAFVASVVARVLFRQKWQGLGRWFQRLVDVTLVVLALVLGTQWVLIALR